jgi:SAM-dependent methyltransferase
MPTQAQHAVLPKATHDENARQEYAKSMRAYVTGTLTPGNRVIYERRALPAFLRTHNYPPETRKEVRDVMLREPYHQVWSAMMRTTQEMMWDSIGDSIERQLGELVETAKPNGRAKGSLTLDGDLKMPRYVTAVDIHCMPGNYTGDLCEDDVFAGALYDRGVYLYMMGGMGPYNASTGETLIGYMKTEHPAFRPARILDIGCSVGHSTLPYVDAFPEAEVHAIDVSAAMVRYAHGRAEALGKAVHFAQQNAEHTNYPGGHFDLIVSHIMLHETSNRALRNIMRESRRLLAPGGLALHLEVPAFGGKAPFDQYLTDWDTHFNAEPFIGTLHDLPREDLMREAGFGGGEIIVADVPIQIYADGGGGNYSHHVGPNMCVFGGRKG